MNGTKKFDCGCEFPLDENGRVVFDSDVEKINLDCPRIWELLGTGRTTGIFQLESRLGSSFAKKLKPENIDQVSGLIAAIRPGALDSIIDGKSITQHYVNRKNKEEEVSYYHPALEEILKDTYGLLIYQEQALFIASKLAGFTLIQADLLRRAIGKKKPEEMAKVKEQFLEGCKTVGLVTDEEATEIFGMIEKSQRYSFNKSHSVSYSMNALLTCYVKCHWPHEFFTSSLHYSHNKPKPFEEIRALVSDLRSFNIPIKPPLLYNLNKNFKLIDDTIFFGLTNIKGVGNSVYNKLQKTLKTQAIKLDKQFCDQFNWPELLFFILPNITSTAVKAMIDVGCLSYFRLDRKQMKYEYEKYCLLSDKEQEWVQRNYDKYKWTTLLDCINTLIQLPTGKMGACANKKRQNLMEEISLSLKNPSYSLKDGIVYVAEVEESLLGAPISYTTVESCDIESANIVCSEFNKGVRKNLYFLACQIDRKHEITTKNHKKMCFLTCSDISGSIDSVVVFPEPYAQHRPFLYDKNNIMLVGERGKDKGSFIVKKIYQL